MKPIIIDMRNMSDSTEVYESKPNPFMTVFIYLVLAMLVTALVWMYFFKLDIVVKGTGTIVAAEEVATITNQISGTITEKMIQDGQRVESGDVLYTVSVESQILQLDTLEKQLADNEDRMVMLKAYEEWLKEEAGWPDTLAGNLYYSEFVSRKNLVELGKESTLLAYNNEMSGYAAKLDANAEMITYYEGAISKSKQMIEDIKNKKNSFATEDTYYWNTVENFLVQYQNMILQYEDTINQFRKELSSAEDNIASLTQKKEGLQNQLQEQPIPVLTVSSGDSASGNQEEENQKLLEAQIQELDTQITAQQKVKAVAEKNISDGIIQKDSALNAYEKESIVAIENLIFNYQQNITSYEGANAEYQNSQSLLESQGTELEVNNLVVQERYSVAEELEACRQTQLQIEQQIDSLQQSIEDATVKATMGGVVNLAIDPVQGDYIAAGQQVLTIIPGSKEGEFVVRSYVENKDIAKVHEGMEVTYEIAAYPSREYGTLKGTVTFVSPDLKVNNNGSAYYVVETSIEASELRNSVGEEATLKVGMLCETKVVVEEKSVLEVLIEKIFHLGE